MRTDGRTDRQTDIQTDMSKLIVASRNFTNAPKYWILNLLLVLAVLNLLVFKQFIVFL